MTRLWFTGGGSLIAVALAQSVIAAGGRVVMCDRNADVAGEVEETLAGSGTFLTDDVTDDAFLDQVLGTAAERFGGIDGIVSAAATFDDDLFATIRFRPRRTMIVVDFAGRDGV